MARNLTAAEHVGRSFDELSRAMRNLLIDNKNFHAREHGYFATVPQTADYVRGPLKGQAEHLIEKLGELKTYAVDMATGVLVEEASDEQLLSELARRGLAVLMTKPIAEIVQETGAEAERVVTNLPRLREAIAASSAPDAAADVAWNLLLGEDATPSR